MATIVEAGHTLRRRDDDVIVRRRFSWASVLLRFAQTKPLGATGLGILTFFIFLALFGPALAPYSPIEIQPQMKLLPPSSQHWFGTDAVGRDVLSRTLVGARLSILVGLTVVLAGSAAVVFGVSSAHFGGKYDLLLQRLIDASDSFPSLILAIALIAVVGPSMVSVILVLTITSFPRIARVVRSTALGIRENTYVEAARALGAGHWRIMLRHLAPNCMATIIIVATNSLGAVILAESSLSFLGLGAPEDVPSWGAMLTGSQLRYFAIAPWIGLFPGLAMSLVVFGINVFGDALRDVLDPRLRSG